MSGHGAGGGREQDRFSRVVSVTMVLVTLAAALVGYLLTQASTSGDEAAARAQRLSLQAMGSVTREQASAQVDVETFSLAEQQRIRAAAARQRRLFGTAADASALEQEEARWARTAARTEQLTRISSTGRYGPARDPDFPTRWYVSHQGASLRLSALQDAANEESSSWGGRFAAYTAILTMFAVALYLLGFSLTLPRVARRLFFTLGIGLSVAGGAWAGTLAADAPARAPDRAADEFAQGEILSQTAYTPKDYAAAIAHYSRAIELHPTFARAYVSRADAEFNAGSPQSGVFTSLTTPEALERGTADLRQAIALGGGNALVEGNLGFNEFLLATREGRPELLRSAERHARSAIAAGPGFLTFVYNLGLVLLAEGRPAAARAAYSDAIERTIYVDVDRRMLRDDEQYEEELVAGALTDLETLVAARPELRGDALALKELIVGSVSRRRLGRPTGRATLGKPVADVFAGKVQVRSLALKHFDFDGDVLSWQWYVEGPHGLGWSVLPQVSGTVFTDPEGYGPGDLQLDLDDRTYFVLRQYLEWTYPPRCLARGRYRVELYVNGRLAGKAETRPPFGALKAAVARNLDLRLCRPGSWRVSDRSIEGLLDGWVSRDRKRGVYVFRVDAPTRYEDLPAREESARVLRELIGRFASVFPSAPTFAGHGRSDYFLGLDGGRTELYRYPGGRVLAGAGVTDDGGVIAAAVFAPGADFDGHLPSDVFDSIVLPG